MFAVFGGSDVLLGPVLGAAILTAMPEVLRFMSDYRYILYGAVLVTMMIYRPQGLVDARLLAHLPRRRKAEAA